MREEEKEEEEAERRFCFLNDRAGCGGAEYAAGLLLEVWARPRFAIELIYSSMRGCLQLVSSGAKFGSRDVIGRQCPVMTYSAFVLL